MAKSRWYEDGLRFECTQCGACCSGEPGYVWVNLDEIRAMAGALEMEEAQFRSKYVRRVGSRFSLVEHENGDCALLDPDSRGCKVYDARPTQCRTWPFWPSNLATQRAWRETCEECPGAGKGRLYSLEEIEVERKKKRV